MTPEAQVEVWRKLIQGAGKSWVLFEPGTCVILMQPEADLEAQARHLLAEHGPVHEGTPSGDFEVIGLDDGLGWVVAGHHPDVLTHVSLEELGADTLDLAVGLLGRGKRAEAAEGLRALHVEDRRRVSSRRCGSSPHRPAQAARGMRCCRCRPRSCSSAGRRARRPG